MHYNHTSLTMQFPASSMYHLCYLCRSVIRNLKANLPEPTMCNFLHGWNNIVKIQSNPETKILSKAKCLIFNLFLSQHHNVGTVLGLMSPTKFGSITLNEISLVVLDMQFAYEPIIYPTYIIQVELLSVLF